MSKINVKEVSPLVVQEAQAMYECYIANSDGKNYQGLPCPPWLELTEAVQSHWCSVAVGRTDTHVHLLRSVFDDLTKKAAENREVVTDLDAALVKLFTYYYGEIEWKYDLLTDEERRAITPQLFTQLTTWARSQQLRQLIKSTWPVNPPPDLWADVSAFHKKFGLIYEGAPRFLLDLWRTQNGGISSMSTFRTNFLREELKEYKENIDAGELQAALPLAKRDMVELQSALEGSLDALVDLVYVALGNAYLHGFNFPEAWRRVHEANMKKERAQAATESARGGRFDVVKPPGWTPPWHGDLVENHAHQTDEPVNVPPPKEFSNVDG